MVKSVLMILLTMNVVLLSCLNADSVKASVNTTEVVKGNPIQLRIKAVGSVAALPNIHEINGISVTNSGTAKSTSMRITAAGMKSETHTTKTYVFVPNSDMVIPSYDINIAGKTYKTDPIQIKVVQSKAPTIQNNAKFSFLLKTEKKSVFIGESFVVTLYISVSNSSRGTQIADFVEPASQDFFLNAVEGQKEYQTRDATVIEKRYIATAKKEGTYSISSASAKLGESDRSRQDIFGRYSMRWTPIVSNALEVEVKAQAKETDLVGDFSIVEKLDAQKVKANKPVNLTVKIEGKGSLEDFEFPSYEIDGVTIYSDDAKIETNLVGDKLMSSYSKSFAFISEEDFVIPKRSISVYDPETKEEKVLEVSAYEVSIEGKKVATVMPTNSVQTKSVTPLKSEESRVEKVEVKSTAWWMLVLTFASGALSMYVLRFMPKIFARKEKPYKESEALKILYAHISEGKEVEEMVRKLYAKKSGDKSVKVDKKELREMVEKFR